ncbi:hypothetical protein CR513_32993, partial [Mucuna pruriens]
MMGLNANPEAVKPQPITRTSSSIKSSRMARLIPEIPDPPIVKELEEILRNVEVERKMLKRKLEEAMTLQMLTQEEVNKGRRLSEKISGEA